MSKTVKEFCDLCGGVLYHSLHAWRVPVRVKALSRWFWHGDAERSHEVDICADCVHALKSVMEAQRNQVSKLKQEGSDKSPAELMELRKPLTARRIKNILARRPKS